MTLANTSSLQRQVDCTTIRCLAQKAQSPPRTSRLSLTVFRFSRFFVLTSLTIILPQQVELLANEQAVFFETKIRPVLVEHCYSCHSDKADSIGGKLRLDTRDAILKGGESGQALVPGDPESSLILQAISYDGMEMPPDQQLPPTVIHDFTRWIQDGAFDPRTETQSKDPNSANQDITASVTSEHWSFQPITQPAIPKTNDRQWPKNSIDHFTLHAMEKAGLSPTADARPRALLRRLHYDLTGLPPTFAQIRSFEEAYRTNPDQAIQEVVGQQLASPQFGIRWGRHWLDLARYGESNGDDGLGRNASFPHAWRYRNYVIDSFNRDTPLDRFITEQIAGDLLPHETADERNRLLTATGFLAIGSKPASAMNNNFAMDIVDDQINVISTGLTGLSVACARCHDHKHDPISTRDYYALAGIFTNTETLYGAAGNEKLTAPPTELHQLTSKLPNPNHVNIDRTKPPELPERFAKEIQKLIPLSYSKLNTEPVNLEVNDASGFDEVSFAKVEKASFKKQLSPGTKDYSISFWFRNQLNNDARPITAYLFSRAAWGEKALPGDHLGIGGKHESDRTGKLFVFNGNDSKRTLAGTTVIPKESWNHITFTRQGDQVRVYLNGQLEINGQLPVTFGKSTDISVSMRSDQFAPLEGNLGHLAIFERALSETESLGLHEISGQPRGPEPIHSFGVAMGVRDKKSLTDCKIHINGESNKLGEIVPRGFLSAYQQNQFEETKPPVIPETHSGRLELAQWITSPNHPQTARVLVNRVWLNLFGQAIVSTPNDFGVYGAKPTHPELLDHLATELIASDWSLKHLIQTIVLSRTYQLSSKSSPTTGELEPSLRDTANQWYTHHLRRRLDAESLRDSVLAATGNLDLTTRDGSDVDSVDMLINWPPGESTNLHQKTMRRSIFLCMLRHAPPSDLIAFDLPDGVNVVGQRETTTMPTQSLFLMNSDFIAEQTQLIAKQIPRPDEQESNVIAMFQQILTRTPTSDEVVRGVQFISTLENSLQQEVTDPDRRSQRVWAGYAQALISTNEFRYVD